jgi:hypothetical protein
MYVLKITVREIECDAFQVAIQIANEGQSFRQSGSIRKAAQDCSF